MTIEQAVAVLYNAKDQILNIQVNNPLMQRDLFGDEFIDQPEAKRLKGVLDLATEYIKAGLDIVKANGYDLMVREKK